MSDLVNRLGSASNKTEMKDADDASRQRMVAGRRASKKE